MGCMCFGSVRANEILNCLDHKYSKGFAVSRCSRGHKTRHLGTCAAIAAHATCGIITTCKSEREHNYSLRYVAPVCKVYPEIKSS